MARSTRARGDTYTEAELADPVPPVRVQRAMLGGDPSLAGTPSSQPSGSEQLSSESATANPLERVPTTDNHSDQTDTADSGVSSTGGVGRKTTQRRSGSPKSRRTDDDF